jgi:hypothetical protein
MDRDIRGSGIEASQAAALWAEMVYMSIKCLNSACPNKYYANETGLCSVCRNNPTTLLLEEAEHKKMQQIEIYLQNRQAKAQAEQREDEILHRQRQVQAACKHCIYSELQFQRRDSTHAHCHSAKCPLCSKTLAEFYETEDNSGISIEETEWYNGLNTEQQNELKIKLERDAY